MNDRYARFLFSTIPLLLFSMFSQAKPVIQSADISESSGKEILTISGSGFGQGPSVALYDTFDNGFAGEIVSGVNAAVDGWHSLKAKYTDADARSGSLSALVAENQNITGMVFGVADSEGMHGLKHFTEVYFSYSIKDLGVFPGANGTATSFSTESATKDAWMMFGWRGDNTDYAVNTLGVEQGHDLYIPAWTGAGFNVAGNETQMTPSYWQPMINDLWAFDDWNTVSFHAKLDVNNPYGNADGFVEFISSKGYAINLRSGNLMSDQVSEGVSVAAWDRIGFMSWVRKTEGMERVMDDIYVALGDNSNARVILSDAPTFDGSTKVVHLLPLTWGDQQITIDYSAAKIKGDEPIYLHVIDGFNIGVATGHLLQTTRAKPPSNFSATTSSN